MSQFKGTKGPWEMDGNDGSGAVEDRNGKIIATVWSRTGRAVHSSAPDVDRARANANLIAAAPELLDALQNIIWKLNRNEVKEGYRSDITSPAKIDRRDVVIREAKVAIEKALEG